MWKERASTVPKADPFAQHRLTDLAALDRSLAGAEHRRSSLPELAEIAQGHSRLAELISAKVRAETEVKDLNRDARKLDQEIDQVRDRAARDAGRLTAGTSGARDLENLQHEIESLARRQGVLEDEALELMERQETADAELAMVTADHDGIAGQVAAAEQRRDDIFAELAGETGRLQAARTELTSRLPVDLLAIYERIRASGKIAAAELRGTQCGACRIDLDKVELAAIRSAPLDEVVRCGECGAILIRS